jgi:hypothetical protein
VDCPNLSRLACAKYLSIYLTNYTSRRYGGRVGHSVVKILCSVDKAGPLVETRSFCMVNRLSQLQEVIQHKEKYLCMTRRI